MNAAELFDAGADEKFLNCSCRVREKRTQEGAGTSGPALVRVQFPCPSSDLTPNACSYHFMLLSHDTNTNENNGLAYAKARYVCPFVTPYARFRSFVCYRNHPDGNLSLKLLRNRESTTSAFDKEEITFASRVPSQKKYCEWSSTTSSCGFC